MSGLRGKGGGGGAAQATVIAIRGDNPHKNWTIKHVPNASNASNACERLSMAQRHRCSKLDSGAGERPCDGFVSVTHFFGGGRARVRLRRVYGWL